MKETSIRTWLRGTALCTAAILLVACDKREGGSPADEDEPLQHRTTFVHLFEWDWPSVAVECEEFLGPAGYAAVQVSPPQEHAEGPQWWTRYQPVSYQLVSRSGTREQFVDMVERCAAAGVGIYVDAVLNHMTGVYAGTGVAGTEFGEYEYPGLYGYDDFNHCGRNENDDIRNFDDVWEVHNCELVNLADLRTDQPDVQEKLAGYLNDLLSVGVAGFRLDAAKHMPPADITAILERIDEGPLVFQEIIAGGPITTEMYAGVAMVTEFAYHHAMRDAFRDGQLEALRNLGFEGSYVASDKAVVFVDNHDTQRHGHDQGFNYKDGRRYTLANIFMLAWPYGYPKVMSSYEFEDTAAGAPDRPPVTAGAASCSPGWVCEHRQPAIAKMAAFRNATHGEPANQWQEHAGRAISFGRGDQGHVVINTGDEPIDVEVRTSLEAGEYCDILTAAAGDLASCGADVVRVGADGLFTIRLEPLGAVALHASARP